ncbi:conserved hypothetical protein [Ricinus communis]|uniref:Uncharacterized protein n=1 Tax=Ricinus communis TaxID=3988 RepID=B9RWS9_RICCO|nr:conserved hypothetical protein [Ricinus communis]
MRPMQMEFFADMDEQGSSVAMDVDDVDPLEIFGEGKKPAFQLSNELRIHRLRPLFLTIKVALVI